MNNAKVVDLNGQRNVIFDNTLIYEIKPFKGRDSIKILGKLTKYGSKSFGGLLRGVANGDQDADAISMIVAGSLNDAFSDLDDPVLQFFITDELFANVTRNNQPFDFDKEYDVAGLLKIFEVMKNVISYNYASVFKQLGISAHTHQEEVKE